MSFLDVTPVACLLLRHLSSAEVLALACTCRAARTAVIQNVHHFKFDRSINGKLLGSLKRRRITDSTLAQLNSMVALRCMNLQGCNKVTDAGIGFLSSLTNLSKLNLSGCHRITSHGISCIGRLPCLEQLNLSRCDQITGDDLLALQGLTGLWFLELAGCTRMSGLGHLSVLTSLARLNLTACTGVTSETIAHIAVLSNLQHLDISCCRQLTTAALGHLSKLQRLQWLDLQNCFRSEHHTVVVAACSQLRHLSRLQHLDLRCCFQDMSATACVSLLSHLSTLDNLQHLHLRQLDNLSNDALALIQALSGLQHLELSCCSELLSSVGLAPLSSLTRLRRLQFPSRPPASLVNSCLAPLSALVQLEQLDLNVWGFLPHGRVRLHLTYLSPLTALQHLQLSFINGSDSWVHLRNLVNLGHLSLRHCDVDISSFAAQVTALTWLSLESCGSVTSLDCLSPSCPLRHLDILGCFNITPAGLSRLHELTSLASLHMDNLPRAADGPGPSILKLHLPHLTRLTSLTVRGRGSGANDGGRLLAAICSAATNLRQLYLPCCSGLQGHDLACLSSLHRLCMLDLSGCRDVGSGEWVGLSVLTSLEALSLCDCHATEDTRLQLSTLTDLECIDVTPTPIL